MLGIALLILKHQLSGNQFNTGLEKVFPSNLNGMYEGLVNYEPGQPKFSKSLIRIHIFVCDFRIENLEVKFTRTTQEKVYAQPVLLCKEIYYHDKDGSKPPQREFMSGYIYMYGENLEIASYFGSMGAKDKVESVYNPITGNTLKNTGILEKKTNPDRFPFKILNAGVSEIEASIMPKIQSHFVRKTSYRELPAVFSPFLKYVIDQKQGSSQKYILAINGYGTGSPHLYSKGIRWSDSDINVYMTNTGWNVLKDNPSTSAVKKLEDELIRIVENDKQGLHTHLMYLPKIMTLRVHVADPDVSSQANLFNVHITERQGDVKYALEYTEAGKSLTQRAVQADKEKALAEQKRKEIALQSAKEQMALHQIRADLFKSKGFVIKPLSFWNKYPLTGVTLKAIHEGDFRIEKNNDLARGLFLMYMKSMNGSCSNLLPPNKKKIDYTYTSEKDTYSHTTWDGEWNLDSFEDQYITEIETHNGEFYLDPRFEETYREVRNIFENATVASLFNPGFNPFHYIAEMKELNSFLIEVDCNKEDMFILGENLLRFFNGRKSLQEEKGITN